MVELQSPTKRAKSGEPSDIGGMGSGLMCRGVPTLPMSVVKRVGYVLHFIKLSREMAAAESQLCMHVR